MLLDSLTENQRYRLYSLPYRVGVYISESDDSGGEAANENERRAIENLIHGFSDGVFGSELVQNIMALTIEYKNQWAAWDENIENVPDECRDALAILSGVVDYKERSAYATRIMEIGEAVALAFRETSDISFFGSLKLRLDHFKACQRAKGQGLPPRSFDDYLAISQDERAALYKLSRALGVDYA